MLRPTNPNVITSSHIQGCGNYATLEQRVPVVRPADRYRELHTTMNDPWGYQYVDTNYKTPLVLLRTFAGCLNMGDNLLLDIGPKGDGVAPAEQVAVLEKFGYWTKKHKEAIYEMHVDIPRKHFQGYTALNRAGDTPYLYLPYKSNGPTGVEGFVSKVNRVWVAGNGAMSPYKVYNKNYWNEVPEGLYINIPERVQDK